MMFWGGKIKKGHFIMMFYSRNGGKTNTADALLTMYRDVFTSSGGDQNGVPNKGILVTDGGSNINRGSTGSRAQEARDRGMHMM